MIEHDEFLSVADVGKMLGYSRSTVWKKAKTDDFPQKIYLSEQAVRWSRAEVLAWMESKKGARANG